MRTSLLAPIACGALLFTACKKESTSPTGDTSTPVTTSQILQGFAANIADANYTDLADKTSTLKDLISTFNAAPTDADLDACRTAWRNARNAWEQSEACLFGPVSSDNIDPRIDTWPVNFTDLEAQLAGGSTFDAAYINGLEDALKGFHPIEYLLWGQNGTKTAAQFTPREHEYLLALSVNLKDLTAELHTTWDTEASGYHQTFTTAGAGNVVYPTQRAAFEELVNAMAGICDEVANGKIGEPFTLQDPSLEESPYSGNSMTDFRNNMRGVENVYLGRYATDGAALEDLVREHDLQLDASVKQHIAAAKQALDNVTLPFGEAITSQPVQVQNAIDAINALAVVLEDELMPFVQLHTN
ncbi:MAG: peptidase M75 [Flavobacteriales bacterium]|nr:peptidase M75 [Flavobacteriales bacterium]